MKICLVQFTSGPDPVDNTARLIQILQNVPADTHLISLPEVVNRIADHAEHVTGDPSLEALRDYAKTRGMWVHIGSLSVPSKGEVGLANRTYLIDPQGEIRATYDKIHLFDVDISPNERFRESGSFVPGTRAVVVDTPLARFGLSICYDLRFPHLYRDLAQAGAQVIFVPAAFAMTTGAAHWETLLRARAIETGCYIVAAAQTGDHPGSKRHSYGHSMVVDPWGQVVLDAGIETGLYYTTLELQRIDDARKKLPSLAHDRPYTLETLYIGNPVMNDVCNE